MRILLKVDGNRWVRGKEYIKVEQNWNIRCFEMQLEKLELKLMIPCSFLTSSVKTQLSYLHWKWAGVGWDYHGGFWFIRIHSIIPVLNAPRPLCQGVDTEDASYDHGTICSWDEFTIWSLFLGNICQGEKLMIRTMWEETELSRLEAVSDMIYMMAVASLSSTDTLPCQEYHWLLRLILQKRP